MTSHPQQPKERDGIRVEHTDATTRITFNRPDRLNALTTAMLTSAADAVETAADDATVRAMVLTGTGRAFSTGADLAAEDQVPPGPESVDAANRLTRALRAVPKPVIAAVNGPAAGVGCSIALAADLTVACESAYFLLAFTRVGLMPDGGATALIPAAVGRARTTRMAMLAEPIPAHLAYEWGMISHLVTDDSLTAETDQLATQLAHGPTLAYAHTKRALNATTLALDQALALERDGQTTLFRTEDLAEGIDAFNQKRTPHFTGN